MELSKSLTTWRVTPPCGRTNHWLLTERRKSKSSGSDNIAIGRSAGLNLAGDSNIVIGQFAGMNLMRGNNNIEIGNEGGPKDSETSTWATRAGRRKPSEPGLAA
ncbi:MAG: hypothetical protein H0X34_16420 [Chthoniobacterales bacterium]|nr:hypothetical protein [Chthoniobacterales bacterium]